MTINRTSELEISKSVLRVLAVMANGEATIAQLVKRIPDVINLTTADRQPSITREGEELWEQIVRNIVSHKKSHGNIISEGFANSPSRGKLRITDIGRKHLENLK